MDFLLLTVALSVQMLAGFGVYRLLMRNQPPASLTELFALSFLLGVTIVTLCLFVFGFFISGKGLLWSVTAACLVIGWIGWQRQKFQIRFRDFWPQNTTEKFLLAINLVQIAVVGWLCSVRVLGWDGLFNYEIKASLAFLNGGVLPLSYFSDPSRDWTHQDYPLLLPLAENWLYLWLGRSDQELAKVVVWMFFVSAVCLLHVANRRFATNRWPMLIPPLMVFTVPLMLIGDGSVSTGYADFPMAVFYLATIIFVIEFWRNENLAALWLAGLMAAAGCWLKQDGIILWSCMAILLCLKALVEIKCWKTDWHKWSQLAMAVSIGWVFFVGWRWFIAAVGAKIRTELQPIRLETLQASADLLPTIIIGVIRELIDLRHWGILWMLTFLCIALATRRNRKRELLVMASAVLLPILAYACLHLFFHGSPLTRLLIHVSLVAVMTVGMTFQYSKKVNSSRG